MTDVKLTGECPVCHGDYRLTKAGKVWRHGDKVSWPPRCCDGAGDAPVRIQALTRETNG